MKLRVSYLFKVTAVLFFICGVVALFVYQPIRPTSYRQKQLYDSDLYQVLSKSGTAKKAWVTQTSQSKEAATNLVVNFFDHRGVTVQAYIPLTKTHYRQGDLINIVYNPRVPQQVRIAPIDEMTMNWSLFGWCMAMGIIFYLLGCFRHKVSGGLE